MEQKLPDSNDFFDEMSLYVFLSHFLELDDKNYAQNQILPVSKQMQSAPSWGIFESIFSLFAGTYIKARLGK